MKSKHLFLGIVILMAVLIFCLSGCSFFSNLNNNGNQNNDKQNNANQKYSINFNLENYATMTFTKKTVIKESDIPVPTDEKKVFAGWYLDKSLSERVLFPYTLNGEVTFYAKWENKLNLSTISEGKSLNDYYFEKLSTVNESDIKEPESIDKEFKGWYLDRNYKTKVNFPYTITQDTEFYAKWEDKICLTLRNKNNVLETNYYINGTSIQEKDIIIPTGEDGYYFTGWYLDFSLTNKVTFPYSLTKNITFFAKWEQIKVLSTIKFITNTSTSASNLNVYIGNKISEKNVPQPTSETKDFVGWYLDSGFTQKVTFPFTVNQESITFYAKWEDKISLNLILDEDNKNTLLYKNNTIINNSDLEIPSKENKIFDGWYLNTEYTEVVSFPFTLNKETTFYAKWEDVIVDNTVQVSFATNTTEQINTITLTKESVLNEGNIKKLTLEDKVLVGWYYESEFINKVTFPLTVSENIILYAKWENKIILNLQKTASDITTLYYVKQSSVNSSDFEIPSLENMVFSGWYLDLECKNAVSFPYTLTTNVTFYAKWVEKEVIYKIVFNTNVSEVISPMNLKKGTTVNESNIKTLTVENKTFIGWYYDSGLTNKVNFPFTINEDIILYAKWQDYIHLKYETNCDLVLEETIFTNITNINISDITIPENSVERDFLGWYLDSSLTNPVTYPYNLNKDTTFYAKWKVYDVCTIKYMIGSESCYYVFKKNTEVKLEDLKTEYNPYYAKKFKAFYLDDSYSKKLEFPFTITENLNLTILWEEFYVITFETNGGTEIERRVGEVYLTGVPLTNKFGYVATGLSTDKEGKNIISYPYLVPEAGITLYVVWEKLPDTKYYLNFDESVPGNYDSLYISVLTEDLLPTPTVEGYKFVKWKFSWGEEVTFPYQLREDTTIKAVFEKDILRNEDALKKIKICFEGLSRDFLSELYNYYGAGGNDSFIYKNQGFFIKAKNWAPDESSDEYIINNILTDGTCFDALRYNILDYSSVDALKNNTNSFRYKVTIDLDKWWNFEYPYEMEEYIEEYITSLYDNNFERMQYELLCYMLDKKDQLNNFTSEKLTELYNEYLQVYTYFGFSTTDAEKIRELLMSIAPETYDDSILNYSTLVESFLYKYILSDNAMNKEESAL